MIAERQAPTSRSAAQLAMEARVAETQLLEAQGINATARSRLSSLLRAGDQVKAAACKQQIVSTDVLIAELTETAEAFRGAIAAAEASEIEAANQRSFDAIHNRVVKAALATKVLDALIIQFGTAITEWNAAVSDANNALQTHGITPLRDLLAVGTILNLIDMNLYANTDGAIGKKPTIDSIDQLREAISKGGYASLQAAAQTYQTLTLRHAAIYLNLTQPEAA